MKNVAFLKKLKFWPKCDFLDFLATIFKTKMLKKEKTFPRYMILDGSGKFLVIFVQKYLLKRKTKKEEKNTI